ncbi:MAG: hypothetical protein JRG73_15295 [Deltaproteobacteria bacterium]|nr:hypothetical protein [Deltaproteobacteria bacterium]
MYCPGCAAARGIQGSFKLNFLTNNRYNLLLLMAIIENALYWVHHRLTPRSLNARF